MKIIGRAANAVDLTFVGLAFAGLAFTGSAFAEAAYAQAPGSRAPDGVHQYAELAISPAGDRVAAVESVDPFADALSAPHGRLVVRSARTGAVLASYDPCARCRYSALAWAPDGAALAFIGADAAAHAATLEVVRDDHVRPIAVVDGVAGATRWSPDGTSLSILAVAGAHKLVGAVEAGVAQVGDVGAAATQDEQRIAIVSASGGALRYVSPAGAWIYEYDWRPDGRGFVATAAEGNGDNNWWVAKLVAVDIASAGMREIAAPKLQMNFPRISPDGRTVAFIGGLMSDFGSVGGDIYTVPLSGGAPTDATSGYKGTFTSLAWRGERLIGSATIKDRTAVFALTPGTGGVTILDAAAATLSAGDGHVALSSDGALGASVSQDFTTAPHILAGLLAAMTPITHDNDALKPEVQARSVAWTSDGFDVQGWLLSPLAPAPGKHPMVVEVHGGPSAASTPAYISAHEGLFPIRSLVQRGYYVFMPNPRGSYGQGEAFTRANVRDFGGGDLRDILAGVDAVEKTAPIDDGRLGVLGHSYGGFMTMWTVTHSNRFKAAVAGAGLSNWISYYGENGIDEWMIPFFGASAYDDPAIYQKLSPITYIKAARTPTLIYVGERDVECPAPQSFEFWRGLQAVGDPTSLIVYAGQGHAIRDPADLQDLRHRQLAWFAKYLGL